MRFYITGISEKTGAYVMSMRTGYVPRQNEEIEIDGYVYIVKYVRYILQHGDFSTQDVQLGLARIK